ncbi:MAG: right-handed parallel beta-helix repeat-containing protein, partial [Ignavibacteriaceae bacterium]|nr:right-handed parallel beta-helix repeat-containing protein [Ignavibacteriaceae bacterium]
MRKFINRIFYLTLFLTIIITCNNIFAQNNNNSYVFNGTSSQLYILDGQPVNGDANQNGFGYFNSDATNKQITVQAWVYLIGDTPSGVEIPIAYRTVNNGKTFSMYLKDNKAYFSVGNNNTSTVNTNQLPSFQWLAITGTYDGSTLKIYSGGDLVTSAPFNITTGYSVTNGSTGLFVGKFSAGAFSGLIDEIRIFDIALSDNNINNSGGNGNPAENFPQSLAQYLRGRWSFTEFSYFNSIKSLEDRSDYNNHLRVQNVDQIVNSKHPQLFVVNSTGDAPDLNPGDGVPDAGNGVVTLRAAIQEANALEGYQTIFFNLPGSSPYIIEPGTALPNITEPNYLNATSQGGYSGSPLIQVNGPFGGLTITAGGSTVRGLMINNSSGYSLTLSSAGGNVIESNQIAGILINSTANNINSNVITGSIGDGISIIADAGNNLIGTSVSNNIYGNAGYGISISNANNNQISNNTIGTNNGGGISLNNSTANISLNSINQNTGDGITITGANSNTVEGNTVTENSGLGISANGSAGNQLTNNTVGSNTLGGISLTNSAASLIGNTVAGNLAFGISLTASSSSTISGNTISGNSSDGLIINGNDNSLTDNIVTNNAGLGISLSAGSGNQLTNNTVETNSLGGISLIDSMTTLTGNTVTGNLTFGISLNTSNGNTLSGNTVSGNSSDGLIINGNDNTLTENSVTNNTGLGITLTAGTGNQL